MSEQPAISRSGTTTAGSPITQDALDRLEANLSTAFITGMSGLKELMLTRFAEHERRINDLNNSHDKAIEAKRMSDEAATRIAERAVTKAELESWKAEVNKRLDIAAGAAKTWAAFGAVAGSVVAAVLVGIVSRFLFPR